MVYDTEYIYWLYYTEFAGKKKTTYLKRYERTGIILSVQFVRPWKYTINITLGVSFFVPIWTDSIPICES